MKKLSYILYAIVLFSLSSCGYNSMVEKEEAIKGKWSQVENVYQRRADLIPNIVNTVKGYAAHESQTLEKVTNARANATKVSINVDDLSEENLKKFEAAQGELSSALSRLLAVSENYPNLKADGLFTNLQVELEGTENRIANERRMFSESVQDYNAYIRKFPNNLTAMMFGFKSKPYFEAKAGADTAPEVKF